MIHAPFNFVPLSKIVFSPKGGEDKISQDVPFSDGICGMIELKIVAKTPLFIRNGHTREDKNVSFSKAPDGRYFIPGTSLKGEVRTVFEILTFGKLGQVENESFAFRDLSPRGNDATIYKEYMKKYPIHGGWLLLENDKYYLVDAGEISRSNRVTAQEIDNMLKTNFCNFIKNGKFNIDANREAKIKYEKIFEKLKRSASESFIDSDLYPYKWKGRGYLIMTGQPGSRSNRDRKGNTVPWKGKYKEFIFSKGPNEGKKMEVNEQDINSFLSIHKNSNDFTQFWKLRLKKGKPIPVFYQDVNIDGVPHHYIGLTYMYKYPAKYDIYRAIPKDKLRNREEAKKNMPKDLDMAELLFGYTYKESLRGRVQFGNAFATKIKGGETEIKYVLSSPHPSYYPLYVTRGQSWNSRNRIEIAGIKRYPVREVEMGGKELLQGMDPQSNMTSCMKPLEAGSEFNGHIRFHNLQPYEFGALLSSITFLNRKECFHNLGSCKPYGYGKVEMNIQKMKVVYPDYEVKEFSGEALNKSVDSYIETYKKMVGEAYFNDISVRELLAMAKGIDRDKQNLFTYMKMSTQRNENEFLQAKDKEELPLFTDILRNNRSSRVVIPSTK